MQVARQRLVGAVAVPTFLYGTAWKEDATRGCVEAALAAGFRGIDTANQRKHYHEAAVGEAIRAALDEGAVARGDLFVQTKFTHLGGQDHRLPYDPRAPVGEQVAQSFESSLEHLGVEAIDSYVLHGPSQRRGLAAQDWEAWRAMEALHGSGRARLLGVSNVGADQLEELCGLARVRPAFVQNRCFAQLGWDRAVRSVCERFGVVHQPFSLLTANDRALHAAPVRQLASRLGRTVPQLVFRFALQLGALPLTGTTDPAHMREDLEAYDFELDDEAMRVLAAAG